MSSEKYTNIVGVPFKRYVKDQLLTRSFQGSTLTRDNNQIIYLANKNCWIRLVSFVDVVDRDNPMQNKDYLAKNWILFGGTSYVGADNNTLNLRSGIQQNFTADPVNLSDQSITNNSAYGLGGIEQLGYRPMPGIISATVEHAGTAGSLRIANIKFKVWNRQQLDIIDTLYFRLGYSCLLEWGHTSYLKNNTGELETTILPLDIFNDSALKTKEGIALKISEKRRETFGNYDAMYGLISNYEWVQSTDGGYDCSIKLTGLGSIIDSLKINQVYGQTLAEGKPSKQGGNNNFSSVGQNAPVNAPSLREPKLVDGKLVYPDLGLAYSPEKDEIKLNTDYLKNNYGTYKIKYVYQGDTTDVVAGQLKDGIYTEKFLTFNGYSQVEEILGTDPLFFFRIEPSVDITGKKTQQGKIVLYNQFDALEPLSVYLAKARDKQTGEIKNVLSEKSLGDNIIELSSTVLNGILPLSVSAIAQQALSSKKTSILKNVYLILELPYDESAFRYIKPNTPSVNTLTSVDPKDTDKSLQRTLLLFYNTYYSTYFTESKKQSERDVNIYVETRADRVITATTDNLVLQKNKLNNNNVAEIRVAIKVNDSVDSYNDSNAIRAGVANKLLENIIQSVQNVYNSFQYKSQIELKLRNVEDKLKKELFNQNTSKGNNSWRVSDIVVATIFYRFDEKALLNSSNTNSNIPVDALDPIQSTLPTIYTSNLDKFLIALRDSADTERVGRINRKEFIESQLINGPIEKIRTKNITIDPTKPLYSLSSEEILYAFIQKGFNSELVSGELEDRRNLTLSNIKVPSVNFSNPSDENFLFEIYKSGIFDEVGTGETSKFIYIKLGTLLYYINNLCLLYESDGEEGTKKPFVYIDFNPATNFCLTTQYHFSVDPGICILPINLSDEAYLSLFPGNLLEKELAFTTKEDNVSNQVRTGFNKDILNTRGNLMNLGINIDYIINLLNSQSKSNPKSDVYLRSFLEVMMDDINKSLGNINKFRVGYYDDGNTVRIYDDQFINPPLDQATISSNNAPLFPTGISVLGKNSIVKSLNLKTETSTALSNQIAISAQVGNFGAMNSDASSFGNLNINSRFSLVDRVMQNKQTAVNPKLNKKQVDALEADKSAARNFNKHIKNIYNAQTYVKSDVDVAKNYYSSAANKLKAEKDTTRSRQVLPISINVTMDGISGMSILEGFTIPTDVLPNQYLDEQGKTKVGFVVAGLTHNIEGNQWSTTIRGQMINLPIPGSNNSSEFGPPSISGNIGKAKPANYLNNQEVVDLGRLNLTADYLEKAFIFIAEEESFRSRSYWDVNAYRVGYGNDRFIDTDNKLKSVTSNTVITQEQAKNTLIYDIKNRFEPGVINQIGQSNWASLNANQKAALLSYAYNAGAGALSTWGVANSIKNRNFQQAANNIARGPVTGGGVLYESLVKRRKKEASLFLS